MIINLIFIFDFIGIIYNMIIRTLTWALINKIHIIVNELRQILNLILGGNYEAEDEYDKKNSNDVSFNEEEELNIILENHIEYNF